MYLANFLNKLFKKNGFILIDANNNKYNIGYPKKENPITLKILDKRLHYKLLLYPDLYFGEAYSDGSIIIENGSLKSFEQIEDNGGLNAYPEALWKIFNGQSVCKVIVKVSK